MASQPYNPLGSVLEKQGRDKALARHAAGQCSIPGTADMPGVTPEHKAREKPEH